ncbi:MAG TPA: hypothetical protein VF762_21100 [Blastocatellia bacterium]|jgi:hypothetical protein
MAEQQVQEFASRVTARLGDKVESIVAYSHPFTNGGVVIVFGTDAGFMPDRIAEVYECAPPNITLYCLRRSELFQISFPGVFGWPNPLEEKPLLAYRVKHKGEVIYGSDIRDDIEIGYDAASLLDMQVQRCKQFIRNWTLDQFRRRNYAGIVKEMDRQTRYLMATSLLARGEWDVPLESIPERFESVLKDSETKRTWADIHSMALAAARPEQDTSRETAAEAVWLFEQVLRSIGRNDDDRDR